jgi:hypothetical protein
MLDLKDFRFLKTKSVLTLGVLNKIGSYGSGFDKSTHYFYHCVSGECS